jgi:hypothetical protein
MEIGLQLEVIYQDNDLVEVRVSAWNSLFGGSSDVYLNKGELRELAGKLRGFPNSPSAGGRVLINFHCTDGSGHAHVEAKIESNDAAGSRQSAILFLPIEASAVDSFVDALSGLEESVNAAAFLTSTIIPR